MTEEETKLLFDKHMAMKVIELEEEALEEKKWVVRTLDMNDYDHYLEYKEHAINGMMIFGDKFVEALGIALSEADDRQSVKIIHAFRNECSTHEMLHRMHVAKQVAFDPASPAGDETVYHQL